MPSTVCVSCKRLVCPGGRVKEGNFHILIRNETITEILDKADFQPESVDHHYTADIVTPGFIDIHNHGVGRTEGPDGLDLDKYWKYPEYPQKLFPKLGVTSFLATMVLPKDNKKSETFEIIQTLEIIIGKPGNGAICEGIHAEGPIVNDLGGLPESDNEMDITEFTRLLDSMPSCKVMTISPHVDRKSDYQRIKLLHERGIVPSLGHDKIATEDDILGALQTDPSVQFHITHIFNVCTFHHRNPSLVNFGLTEVFPKLDKYSGLTPPSVEVIGDMRHVHPLTISTLLKTRSINNVAFISDCTAESNPGKKVKYCGRDVEVSADGKCLYLSGSETIAGSCCSVKDAFHSLVETLGLNIGEAVAMVTETPARIAKLDHIGKIEVNKRADLLLFDSELNLQKTIVAGQLVYSA
ncbi:N-acetylgalactosamine-6-phosphate deacetylase-like [Saccoglossus kowalevskii]|uniref:N-acetylglucosamine-6-phosphate deacetylase-like isoform X1 n=1 Tax=Saccoglossus kowalevskii TaxID=10224 RepID=A0ABM0M0G0_SACKO|nr:PREDICTED: putative N-acetylglucosamine-6-phosphate deacetylase-like isoform X1 [Saccoglossus kowalevskii]XP_006813501.1 PREDICTED: putative N-acetylglucosamine-6-phosphate deacetylase-like isoform X2 [Saccoglossus kowalevskii]